MNTQKNIVIYGDSLMKGTIIDDRLRYHATIADMLDNLESQFSLHFQNKARFGITVEKGKRILEKDLHEGLFCDYAVLEFGGNDCSFYWDQVSKAPEETHTPLTPIARFIETLNDMVTQIKKRGIVPVLMTLPPIDAERYLSFISRGENDEGRILQWLGDTQMIYRFHEMYSRAITEIAEQTKTLMIDVRSHFLDKHNFKELIGLDGVHLAPAGYQELLAACVSFISSTRMHAVSPAAI